MLSARSWLSSLGGLMLAQTAQAGPDLLRPDADFRQPGFDFIDNNELHSPAPVIDHLGWWVSAVPLDDVRLATPPLQLRSVDYTSHQVHPELLLASPGVRRELTRRIDLTVDRARLSPTMPAGPRAPKVSLCLEAGPHGQEAVPVLPDAPSCGPNQLAQPTPYVWNNGTVRADVTTRPVACWQGREGIAVTNLLYRTFSEGAWYAHLDTPPDLTRDVVPSPRMPTFGVTWDVVIMIVARNAHDEPGTRYLTATHYGITRDMCDSDALAAVDPTFEPDELDIVERSARTFAWVLDNGLQALQSHPEWPWPVAGDAAK